MGKTLWSLHKLWGLGVWQGGVGVRKTSAVLPHNLSPKHLTTLLRQFKQNTDMMDLCNGAKEPYSFLFWFPVHVHLCGLIPTAAAAHHLPLFKAKFLSTEIRCPWFLALVCVMPYWEVTRYDKAKSALQEYGFRCNILEQGKKNPLETNHNSTVCASAQGGERQAPVMLILWDSIVFGTQTVVWSAFQESLSKTRKGFPI